MKKKTLALTLAFATMFTGLSFAQGETKSKNQLALKEKTILSQPIEEKGGARATNFARDHQDSLYYKTPDFYNMKSSDTLTILPKFKTYQQST